MTTLILRKRLQAELGGLRSLLEQMDQADLLGRIGFESRIRSIEAELNQVTREAGTKAEVALIFGGKPVVGSSAIEAPFGIRALDVFQRAVSTTFAAQAQEGLVGRRGPHPNVEKSTLHIAEVIHGSFGFVLEEIDPNGDQWLDSPLKVAVDTVVNILDTVTSADGELAQQIIDDLDVRQFANVRDFVKVIYENDSTINVSQSNREILLDRLAVRRGYDRVANIEIKEQEIRLDGTLQGVLPAARRFELQTADALIKGRIAKGIGDDYIRNLEAEPLVGEVTAILLKRTVVDSADTIKEMYTLSTVIKDGIAHPPIT